MAATFKATSIQRDDNSVWLDVKKGLKESPQTRGRNTTIPGARGEIPRNRRASKLPIELYGWIHGSSWGNYWTLVKEILALFDTEGGEGELVVPLDDGTNAKIQARPLSIMPASDEAIGATQYFSIVMEAVDPPEWSYVAVSTGGGQASAVSSTSASGTAHKAGSASAVSQAFATSASGTNP